MEYNIRAYRDLGIRLETVQNYVETVFRVFLTVFHFFYDFPFKKGRDLKYRVEFTKYRFTIFLYRFNPNLGMIPGMSSSTMGSGANFGPARYKNGSIINNLNQGTRLNLTSVKSPIPKFVENTKKLPILD